MVSVISLTPPFQGLWSVCMRIWPGSNAYSKCRHSYLGHVARARQALLSGKNTVPGSAACCELSLSRWSSDPLTESSRPESAIFGCVPFWQAIVFQSKLEEGD